MGRLSENEITSGLSGLAGWERTGDAITRQFEFPGFPDAVAFVVKLAFRAEAANHHPDVDIRYNRVRITLSTHSEGGLTSKDLDLARDIDSLHLNLHHRSG